MPEASLPVFGVVATTGCGKEMGRRDAYVDFGDPDLIEHAESFASDARRMRHKLTLYICGVCQS